MDCGIGVGSSSPGSTDLRSDPVVSQHRVLLFCQLKSMLDIVEMTFLSKCNLFVCFFFKLCFSFLPCWLILLQSSLVCLFDNWPEQDSVCTCSWVVPRRCVSCRRCGDRTRLKQFIFVRRVARTKYHFIKPSSFNTKWIVGVAGKSSH